MVNQPVLIVDDEVEMRIAMSETLKHCGYPVEISHNAIDALKKFKQNDYSLQVNLVCASQYDITFLLSRDNLHQ